MNIIWENKGIILGIILYLIENHEQFKNNIIVIRNTKFNNVITNLFPDMKIMFSGPGFKINIKNQKNSGLIINNLQNLSTINSEKVRVLPWFEMDNPIVMYLYTKKKVYDKDLFEADLRTFNEKTRFKPRQTVDPMYSEFVEQHCGLNIWDTHFEYDILLSYIRYYPGNLFEINQYIDNELGGLRCEKPTLVPVPVQVPVQVRVPVKVKVPVQVSVPVKVPVKVPAEVATKVPVKKKQRQNNNIDMSIDVITDIVAHINKILENGLMRF